MRTAILCLIRDRAVGLCQPQVFRHRPGGMEVQVAPHRHSLRADDGCEIGQLDAAQLGHSDAQVAQTPSGVAIGRVEGCEQPGRMRVRREQAHNGPQVDLRVSSASMAIGQQLRALLVGDKWFSRHGQGAWRCAGTRVASEAPNRKAAFVSLRKDAEALLQKSTHARSLKVGMT